MTTCRGRRATKRTTIGRIVWSLQRSVDEREVNDIPSVMPGLVPGIHALRYRGASPARPRRRRGVDARNKSGHDGKGRSGVPVAGPRQPPARQPIHIGPHRFTRREVLDLVDRVDRAFADWRSVRGTSQADTFLTGLLVFENMRG